jgi:hypothetical protein
VGKKENPNPTNPSFSIEVRGDNTPDPSLSGRLNELGPLS